MHPQLETRKLELHLSRADPKQLTIPASFSSEEPVSRFWGREVLLHTPEAVDLSRARGGVLPLLASHNADEVPRPGNAENVRLVGRKLRGTLKFSDTPRGRELYEAAVSGFSDGISVSYGIQKVRERGSDPDTGQTIYEVTRWQPVEVSLVNLPADATVGVGRSLSPHKESPMQKQMGSEPNIQEDLTSPETREERERVSTMMILGRRHKQEELARQFVESGRPLEEFRHVLLDKIGGDQRPINPVPVAGYGSPGSDAFGIPRAEMQGYSLQRAIASTIGGDPRECGRELDISDHIRRSLGRDSRGGVFVPWSALQQRTTITVGTAGPGYSLVGTEHLGGEFVDLLRPYSVAVAAGARVLEGLQGNVEIPTLGTGSVVYWAAEESDFTESSPVFANITLTPKFAGCLATYSRRTLVQSAPGVEELLRRDFTAALASGMDKAALWGPGTGGQPSGVLTSTAIGTSTTSTGILNWAAIARVVGLVSASDALSGRMAWAVPAGVSAQAMRTAKDSGSGLFCFEPPPQGSLAQGSMAGYAAFVSSNMPTTYGTGSNLSAALFGNWDDLLIGVWGALEIMADPYKYFEKGSVRLRGLFQMDVGLRHAKSFGCVKDCNPSS